MIAVVVNGPLSKDRVRLLGLDQLRVLFVVRIVDNGVAVDLSGVGRPRLEYFASSFRLSDSYGRAGRRPRSVVQVKQHYLVAKLGQASDGAAASVFGIAGMSAGDDNFQFPARRFLGNRAARIKCFCHRVSKDECRSQASGAH